MSKQFMKMSFILVLIISHFIRNEVQQKILKLLLVVMDAGMNLLIPKEANCTKIKFKSV